MPRTKLMVKAARTLLNALARTLASIEAELEQVEPDAELARELRALADEAYDFGTRSFACAERHAPGVPVL
jgi:hypothetical protein